MKDDLADFDMKEELKLEEEGHGEGEEEDVGNHKEEELHD